MTTQISNRDWEALSAYLDGELSARETARMEARLQAEAGLHQALEDLRQTQVFLRSQPKPKAPRNFTLTPEMPAVKNARKPSSGWFASYPVFRLASALAGILLVFVLIGDVFTNRSAGGALQAPSSAALMTESGVEAAKEGGADEAPASEEMQALQMPEAEMPAAENEAAPPAAYLEPMPTGQPGARSQADTADEAPQAFALPRAEGMGGGDGGQVPANPPIQTSAGRLNWRVLEIALAVCVVAFGLAAWYARRRHNA